MPHVPRFYLPRCQTLMAMVVVLAFAGCAKKQPEVEKAPATTDKQVTEAPKPPEQSAPPDAKTPVASENEASAKKANEPAPSETGDAEAKAPPADATTKTGSKGGTSPPTDAATTANLEKIRSILGSAAAIARAGKPAEAIKAAGPAASLLAAHGDDPGYDGVRSEFDAAVKSWTEKLPANARPSGINSRNKTIVEQ